MCTATIVVSLPTLKVLIARSLPSTTSRSSNGYINSESKKHTETVGSKSNPKKSFNFHDTYHSHISGGHTGDDEIELVFQESGKSSPVLA
jgi:hypothetical protein